ncbi:myotubularin-related protein 14-like isoform X3 [Topomyia yanbarensis]|uniref:myotubularin-related protein 14-like isoform X3 n=1 Tax=Topomyia yanbarensis TaxID=2498891 RepID=UPI00273C71BD|nr:myotubularin-related protein 14-like isoform X3 [Topomyia yanbarensis]
MSEILQQDIQQLLEYFAKNLYRAKECEVGDEIVQRCSVLMRMDYTVTELTNPNGELSAHYPAKLLIPEQETKANVSLSTVSPATITERRPRSNASPQSIGSDAVTDSARNAANRDQVIVDGRIDAQRLRYLILRARLARCRARFPLPVILYKGKYICRSATLSGGPEIYGRSGLEYFAYAAEATLPEPGDEAYEAQEDSSSDESDSKDWPLFGRLRRKDIRLLKALNVGTIIDFMVENKKVKFWLNVTSSEKVDKENRYSFFKILALPYPGCEFFREYRDNDCRGEGLIFDWNQSYVDAGIRVPDDAVTAELNIDWHNYKQWDLVKLTQNYLRLLLKYLQENNSGLLVHCISGWDRTPLFVSLLRISLWADGAVHQSLSASQMLYFTIAYDWLLFGHNLPDRLNKGEVIFYFCFYILKYIVDDEFSVLTHRTSPVTVPSAERLLRQRQESTSSLSVGSWQMITCTGSYRSAESVNEMQSHLQPNPAFACPNHLQRQQTQGHQQPHSTHPQSHQQQHHLNPGSGPPGASTPNANQHHSQETSCCTVIDGEYFPNRVDLYALRREKLTQLRTLFYNCYFSTIAFKFNSGPDSALGSLLGNFAEKVGLASRTPV